MLSWFFFGTSAPILPSFVFKRVQIIQNILFNIEHIICNFVPREAKSILLAASGYTIRSDKCSSVGEPSTHATIAVAKKCLLSATFCGDRFHDYLFLQMNTIDLFVF